MASTIVLSDQAQHLLERVLFLRDEGGLSDTDVGRGTGVKPATARSWFSGNHAPSGIRAERVLELTAIVERLLEVFKPGYVSIWLRTPVPALSYEKPIDLIGCGEYMRVAEAVSALESSPAI